MTEADIRRSRSRSLSGYLSLFGSVGTLVCCALPSLLVLLGFGATVAAVLSGVPWLVTLSRHKGLVFAVAGAMIAANAYLGHRSARTMGCAPGEADACMAAHRRTRLVLWISAGLYASGFLVAYALGPILTWLDG
ncbi:MAG: hypothetical protein ACT4PM_03795 [Gemmatimonadales bacterium]